MKCFLLIYILVSPSGDQINFNCVRQRHLVINCVLEVGFQTYTVQLGVDFNIKCIVDQLQDGTDYNTSSCQVVARLTPYTDVFLAFGLTMNPIATPTYCVIKRVSWFLNRFLSIWIHKIFHIYCYLWIC